MCQLFVAVPLLATPCQDINAHSQRWMLQGTGSDCCVFPDVLGFFEGLGNTRQLLAADYMQKFHVVSRAEYKGSSVCLRHGGRAHRSHESGQWASPECAIPAVDLDVAGLPCTDFSSAGLRMAEQGPTILVHLAWARKMLHEQPALILHENVPLYPAQLLQQHLGAIYNLYTFLVSPSDAGFTLQSRRRQYTMLVHKTKAILTHDPYETYAMLRATLQRTTTSPANALLATLTMSERRLCTSARGGASSPHKLALTRWSICSMLGNWERYASTAPCGARASALCRRRCPGVCSSLATTRASGPRGRRTPACRHNA